MHPSSFFRTPLEGEQIISVISKANTEILYQKPTSQMTNSFVNQMDGKISAKVCGFVEISENILFFINFCYSKNVGFYEGFCKKSMMQLCVSFEI